VAVVEPLVPVQVQLQQQQPVEEEAVVVVVVVVAVQGSKNLSRLTFRKFTHHELFVGCNLRLGFPRDRYSRANTSCRCSSTPSSCRLCRRWH
jgi:hypothetical protein